MPAEVATPAAAPANATDAAPIDIGGAPAEGEAEPASVAKAKADADAAAKIAEARASRETRKELIALRKERQRAQRITWEQKQREDRLSAKEQEMEARLKELEADPFEVAAKRRGKTRIEMLEEYNIRELTPDKAAAESKKKAEEDRIAALEQKLAEKEKAEQLAQATEKQRAWRSGFDGATMAALKAGGEDEFPFAHLRPQQAVAQWVYDQTDAHYRQTGEVLPQKSLLAKLESLLQAEDAANEKARDRARLRKAGAPDRENGVVASPQVPEATANPSKGPSTLTQRFASQTSGRTRVLAEKERNAEADKFLLGR